MQILRTKEKNSKIYTIEQGGLRIQSLKNRKLPSESHVPFEQIRRDKFYHVERSPLFVLTGGIFLFISVLIAVSSTSKENPNRNIALAIPGILGVMAFISYFLYRQNVYFVKTYSGTFIKFRINNNAEQVNEFVKTLIAKRDEYLKKNYGAPNHHFSYDAQFSNFHIMHREGILSSVELESNLKELNILFEQTVPKNSFLGYSKN